MQDSNNLRKKIISIEKDIKSAIVKKDSYNVIYLQNELKYIKETLASRETNKKKKY